MDVMREWQRQRNRGIRCERIAERERDRGIGCKVRKEEDNIKIKPPDSKPEK